MTSAAEPLRLVLVSSAYPPVDDRDHPVLWRDIATSLVSQGHAVTVVTTRDGGGGVAVEEGVTVIRRLRERGAATTKTGRSALFGARHDCSRVRGAVRKAKADAIVFVDLMGATAAVLGVRHRAGVAVLCDATPGWMEDIVSGGGQWFRHWAAEPPTLSGRIGRGFMRTFAGVVLGIPVTPLANPPGPFFAVAPEPLAALAQRAPNYPRGRLIEPGVSARLFGDVERATREGARRLLFAGPIARDHGLHTAILALGDLGPDVSLRIVGDMLDPDYMGEVAAMGRAAGVMDRVELRPGARDDELPGLLASADVLVVTSHVAERFPRLVLRAFAAGIVVVGTPVGSRGDVLRDNETGLTFTTGNARELTEKLRTLLADAALETRLRTSARKLVEERFSVAFTAGQVERLVREAIAAARTDAG